VSLVSEYDSRWPESFDEIRARLLPVVEGIAVRVEHVGSTAVPGLAAKPIIDVDIVVASEDQVQPVIDGLGRIGYRWVGDLGVAGREAFNAPPDDDLPAHNLYLVVENSKAHLDHWLLRDLLRADPASRQRYAVLKRQNAVLARGDLDWYVAAKAGFIAELLTRARAERGLPAASHWEPEIPRSIKDDTATKNDEGA
jgi:GrpB-like predicted nucleotidyltransferase (UPF0157 family)